MTDSNIFDQFSLAGKVAFITGAGGGIGSAIAEGFLRAGAAVAICDLNRDAAEQVAEELGQFGTAVAAPCDVTDPDDVERAIEQVVVGLGRLDVVVTAAGAAKRTPTLDLSADEFDAIMRVNLRGTLLPAQAAAKRMVAQGEGGRVITIGSVRGLLGHPLGYASYGASKGAVHLLTKQLAVEWAEHDINVNCIAPSVVATKIGEYILQDPEIRELFMSRIPKKRAIARDELVGTAIYLASRASSFVTGQVLFVDGGNTAS